MELRPHWRNALHWSYKALATLHDTIEAARAADEAAEGLLLQCSSAEFDQVIELSGASELWDVVAAIQHLAESYSGVEVDESNRIPIGLASERHDQLTGQFDITADGFDPPFPTEERLAALRKEHNPMPRAGETTITRILAAATDPRSIEPWVRQPERVRSDPERLADLERRVEPVRAELVDLTTALRCHGETTGAAYAADADAGAAQ